ncbi:MAG: hypothetical protein U0V64_02840 [Cyclobacteriaceae bacterium]
MKRLTVVVLAVMGCSAAVAQSDPIGDEIRGYTEGKAVVINKGRNMVIDRFAAGDRAKVTTVIDYLTAIERNDHYVAFYPLERWLLWYWTGQYDRILDETVRYKELYIDGQTTKVKPLPDDLLHRLEKAMPSNKQEIIDHMTAAMLPDIDRQFLVLNLDYLLTDDASYLVSRREAINAEVEKYLESFPESPYNEYLRDYVRVKFRISDWGWGFELFSGYGKPSGQLSTYFPDMVPFGVAFDVSYKKAVFYFRDYIGFGSLRNDIRFNAATWRRGAHVEMYIPEISAGYPVIDGKRLRVVPFMGLTWTAFLPTDTDKKNTPDYEYVGLNYKQGYTLGVNIDLKFPVKTPYFSGESGNYWFIRVRYGYDMPAFENRSLNFAGDIHYISVGFGAVNHAVRRDR